MAKSKQTLTGLVCDVYKGPFRGWAFYATAAGILVTAFFAYALWKFCGAVGIADHLHWGLAAILAAMVIMLLKIWFWLLMMRESIIRDLKG